jgi:hypothetical protein
MKNKEKNNNNVSVNRINCQTSSTTINKIRRIAHNGIDIERNSIATIKMNTIKSYKHLEILE